MKLSVSIWHLNLAKVCEEKVGEIRWDGSTLTAELADDKLLKHILTRPLWLRGGKTLYAAQHEEQFVRRLCEHLHGSYVWASRAQSA